MEWIKCDERLPECNEEGVSEDKKIRIRVAFHEGQVVETIGFYDRNIERWRLHDGFCIGVVTEWRDMER